MTYRIVLLLAASLVTACAGPQQPQTAPEGAAQPANATVTEVLRPCDDGGSHGGVLINGVCL